MQHIYACYGARDQLPAMHGRGSVSGKPPDATHCNNIGPEHRREIYPFLKRWFDMAVPEQEAAKRHSAQELTCLTPESEKQLKLCPLHELVAALGTERAEAARKRYAELTLPARRLRLRQEWALLLGEAEPKADAKVVKEDRLRIGNVTVERLALEVEPGVLVPLLLLLPARKAEGRLPVVVAFAQQ